MAEGFKVGASQTFHPYFNIISRAKRSLVREFHFTDKRGHQHHAQTFTLPPHEFICYIGTPMPDPITGQMLLPGKHRLVMWVGSELEQLEKMREMAAREGQPFEAWRVYEGSDIPDSKREVTWDLEHMKLSRLGYMRVERKRSLQ